VAQASASAPTRPATNEARNSSLAFATLGIELGVVVYGHWGPPLLGFPTSAATSSSSKGKAWSAR